MGNQDITNNAVVATFVTPGLGPRAGGLLELLGSLGSAAGALDAVLGAVDRFVDTSGQRDVLRQIDAGLTGLESLLDWLEGGPRVIRVCGEEGLSMLFRFTVDLGIPQRVDFAEVVGQPALISLLGKGGVRHVHGVVSRLQQQRTGRHHTVYRATVVPAVHRLQLRQDCRIFQRMDIGEIIGEVLGAAGIEFRFHRQRGQRLDKRDYCVQYRESDWDFVSRLLEDEGFYYFFEFRHDGHVLHMGDFSQLHPDIARSSSLAFREPGSSSAGTEHVSRFFYGEAMRSGRFALTDYNFARPDLDQQVHNEATKDQPLEVYDYPGEYELPEQGSHRAQRRLEETRASRRLGEGDSDCPRMNPGCCFSLDGHDRGSAYLLTTVSHLADKASTEQDSGLLDPRVTYSNGFTCIPRSVPFRPPRTTPVPVVHGVQTAEVVGPAGEEIYTDEYGRVKVHFHWDRLGRRDDNDSCWIRVSQTWAGQGWGAMHIPRIGQEVIVEFVEGNPDRPIITGRVYHARNVTPYVLPEHKTISTVKSDSTIGGGGFNELRFEDKKGAEEVYTHAQKDQNEEVENDMTTWVGRDQTLRVDNDRRKVVGGHQKVKVNKTQRHTVRETSAEKVGLTKTLAVGEDYKITVGADRKLSVGSNMAESVAGAQTESTGLTRRIEVGQRLEIVCGSSTIVLTPDQIEIKGKLVKINS